MNPNPSNQVNRPAAVKPAVENSDRHESTLNPTDQGAHDTADRVGKGAHETVDRQADAAPPPLQQSQHNQKETSDVLGQSAEQLLQMGEEKAESLRAVVRENPLASIAVAAAVGLLLARLGV